MADTTVNQNYDASNIRVLEGLEAVRVRPGMYIGSTSQRGLHHCIYEIVDNSIDESLAGYCDTIHVTVHKDDSVTVQDNGRGIPCDINQIVENQHLKSCTLYFMPVVNLVMVDIKFQVVCTALGLL